MTDKLTISDAMCKSMFVLGAGFSFGTGCKTSTQMFDDLKQRVLDNNKNEDSRLTSTQKEAFKFLISCLQYHSEWRSMETQYKFEFPPNIEELALLIRRIVNRENFLPYPITGNWADKLVSLEAKFQEKEKEQFDEGLFESMDKKLKTLLKEEWLKISTSLDYLEHLLSFFQETTSESYKMDIFTLNNDLVIEKYFSDNHESPWRGFVQGKWQGIDREGHDNEYGRINLFKLHGSIDWIRLQDMDIWEEDKLNSPENELLLEKIEENHNPYLIFGQGTKTFSVEPYFSLINHFNSHLKSKEYCFVIGYSFFDPYINNLLFNAAMNGNKVIIVNPYFGPYEIFQNENGKYKPKADSEDFYRAIFPEKTNKSTLIDYLKEIQRNSFYSELPEFNYSIIKGENIEFIPLETSQFIEKFFSNNGELFLDFISSFEREKKEELPF